MTARCPVSQDHPQQALLGCYERMRAIGPVVRDEATGFYVVVDHALLRRIATDSARFSNNTGLIQVRSGELGDRIRKMQQDHGVAAVPVLLTTDPPVHGFYRSLVDKTLSPARIRALEAFLTQVIDEMIDGFVDAGTVDFVEDMATLVPVNIVAALLGVSRDRVADITRWSDAASSGTDPTLSDDQKLESVRVTCELQRFMLDQANLYRRHPNDSLLSGLANLDVGGRKLSDGELISTAQQIIVAGHETTASAMASAMLWMIRTPGLEARLRDEPGLLTRFIEEVLRLEAPLQGMFRKTTQEIEIGNTIIPEGSIVVMRWGAANRDPDVFKNPAMLDLDRPNGRQHLTFGFGPHFCIGNQLARAELRIAFERMLRRMQRISLASDIDHLSHYFMYGVIGMKIRFEQRKPSSHP